MLRIPSDVRTLSPAASNVSAFLDTSVKSISPVDSLAASETMYVSISFNLIPVEVPEIV